MFESYEFVKRNIISCKNTFQLDACYILVVLFKSRYEADPFSDGALFSNYYNELNRELLEKQTFLNPDA